LPHPDAAKSDGQVPTDDDLIGDLHSEVAVEEDAAAHQFPSRPRKAGHSPVGTVFSREASDDLFTRPKPLRRSRFPKDIESDWQKAAALSDPRKAWRRRA
jgi:hypothetical protein